MKHAPNAAWKTSAGAFACAVAAQRACGFKGQFPKPPRSMGPNNPSLASAMTRMIRLHDRDQPVGSYSPMDRRISEASAGGTGKCEQAFGRK